LEANQIYILKAGWSTALKRHWAAIRIKFYNEWRWRRKKDFVISCNEL